MFESLSEGLQSAFKSLSGKGKLTEAQRHVREGGSLRKALEDAGYFPPMMVYMIASGESSGSLDEMFARAAESQEQDLEGFSAHTFSLIVGYSEPAAPDAGEDT